MKRNLPERRTYMLVIKNLCKTYKSKGGVFVKAVDDISLTFPETGMVFLLGKSGSGKSTLLNLCGGLDFPDSGEIIVMGKSSKDFSPSDFDSYRNTYVGFIFQEYNIFNEFTVEDNLSIALELQGKNNNSAEVERLLSQVGLEGFRKRKPNTLSGGQKQRIAIARALIKDPKIIMADEPTGALDSKTGKQVLDTLKELSRDRLVLIVSHDRDFAEQYGDRIIELADGKVISDVSKEKNQPKKVSENVVMISDNTLSLKHGKDLSSDEIAAISEYIKNADGDVIITKGKGEIDKFKTANKISSDNSSESFGETKAENIKTREYSKEERKFLKSKLPIRKAIKVGASSLKVKPFRLFLTLLLSIAALILLGLASTLMTYSERRTVENTFDNSYYDKLLVSKGYYSTFEEYEDGELVRDYIQKSYIFMSKEDITKIKNKYGSEVLPVFNFAQTYYDSPLQVKNMTSKDRVPDTISSYNLNPVGFACPDQNSSYLSGLIGSYPTNENEVAISNFYAKALLKSTLYYVTDGVVSTREYVVQDINDLIGKKLLVSISGGYNFEMTITGIFNNEPFPQEIAGYEDMEEVKKWEMVQEQNYISFIKETTCKVFFVSSDFYAKTAAKIDYSPRVIDKQYFRYGNSFNSPSRNFSVYNYCVYDKTSDEMLPATFFDSQKDTLASGEILVSEEQLLYFLQDSSYQKDLSESELNDYYAKYAEYISKTEDENSLYVEKQEEYVKSCKDETILNQANEVYGQMQAREADIGSENIDTDEEYQNLKNRYEDLLYQYDSSYSDSRGDYSLKLESDYHYCLYNLYSSLGTNPYSAFSTAYMMRNNLYSDLERRFSKEEMEFVNSILFDYVNYYDKSGLTIYFESSYEGVGSMFVTIVGTYKVPSNIESYNMGVYISADDLSYYKSVYTYDSRTVTKYKPQESDEYYQMVFVPFKSNSAANSSASFDLVYDKYDDDSFYVMNNNLYEEISSITSMVDLLRKVFLYLGIGIAVFAAVLLYNFISLSIHSKMREIGILRAVGARGADVFKIFFSESSIIIGLCLVISLLGSVVITGLINSSIVEELTIDIRLFVFGPVSFLIVIGEAALVAFLGTFLPVFKISRKKPVDSMREL